MYRLSTCGHAQPNFLEAAGAVKAWDYFWGNGTDRDYTHTNDIGGNIVARFVANEMIKNQRSADSRLNQKRI